MAIVSSLLSIGAADEGGIQPASGLGGRPGSLLRFNPSSASVAACRVRLEGIEVTLADGYGTPIGFSRAAVSHEPSELFPAIAAEIQTLHASTPEAGPLRAAGLLIPGLVDRRTGSCIEFAPFGWTYLPARALLEDALGVPVTVLNPAAAAALGEVTRGRGRGHDDVIVIFLDKGIGAGVVTGGRLLQGAFGAVGELGHCAMGHSDGLCACGRRGCLETVASGRVIQRQAGTILGQRAATTMSLAKLEGLNNPEIDAMLSAAAHQLGIAASWLVNMFNPSVVLLGGTDFAVDAKRFLRDFQGTLEAHSLSSGHHAIQVQFAATQSDVWGATAAAMELLPTQLRPSKLYAIP